jgi:hypothetical protein
MMSRTIARALLCRALLCTLLLAPAACLRASSSADQPRDLALLERAPFDDAAPDSRQDLPGNPDLQLADAAVLGSIGGAFQLVEAPASLAPNAVESNTVMLLIPEGRHTLTAPLTVDIAAPGTYQQTTPSQLAAGTEVVSYLVHSDGVNAVTKRTLKATLTVGSAVTQIAIIVNSKRLDSSDAIFGAPTTIYPVGELNRGLEVSGSDLVVVTPGGAIDLTATVSTLVDQARILLVLASP